MKRKQVHLQKQNARKKKLKVEKRLGYLKQIGGKKESFTLSIIDSNENTLWESSKGIKFFNNDAFIKVIDFQLSRIKHPNSNTYLVKHFEWGDYNLLALKKHVKKVYNHKNKRLDTGSKPNFKQEKLLCIHNSKTNQYLRLRKSTADSMVNNDKDWSYIPKHEYKNNINKIIYLEDESNGKIYTLRAKDRSKYSKDWVESTSKKYAEYMNELLYIKPPEASLISKAAVEEYQQTKRRYRLLSKYTQQQRNKNKVKSPLKRRKLKANSFNPSVTYKKTKKPGTAADALREEHKEWRHSKYLKRIELRDKAKVEREKRQVATAHVPQRYERTDPKLKKAKLDARLQSWRYKKMFMKLKSIYNYRKNG